MKNLQQPENLPKKQYSKNNYAHYTGIAFQMIATIAIAAFAGVKLDAYFETNSIFTVVLLILGVAIAMFSVIYGLLKKK